MVTCVLKCEDVLLSCAESSAGVYAIFVILAKLTKCHIMTKNNWLLNVKLPEWDAQGVGLFCQMFSRWDSLILPQPGQVSFHASCLSLCYFFFCCLCECSFLSSFVGCNISLWSGSKCTEGEEFSAGLGEASPIPQSLTGTNVPHETLLDLCCKLQPFLFR